MTRVAILQPNYLPWKGVFDMIQQVDIFIFLDDVQYTPRDWRNRNRIKCSDGSTRWLSVPVIGRREQCVRDVAIDHSQGWARKHTEALRHSYGKTPFFAKYFPRLSEILGTPPTLLADLNIALTLQVCEWLGIRCDFRRSADLAPAGVKDARLIDLVMKAGGTHYLSGPAAQDYIRPERFDLSKIQLSWMDYSGYPVYPQISEPFDPRVTVLDLLFSVGPDAPDYIWGKHRPRVAPRRGEP